ncbi:hypothetical protein ACFWWM_43340 [Streptomyces sp. NPDC058682]|uniref:hypothetical protein n=1 Tax=Streptomyces sp. NPDC058682 TaxID=3346596 RepID=UPI003657980D
MIDYPFDEWFESSPLGERHPAVQRAMDYADGIGLEEHRFFEIAASSPVALRAWVTQELIVTGPFSQALLRLAALVPNVHMRAMVMVVIGGEHGRVVGGRAPGSHPWLLNELRKSMGIEKKEVQPLSETVEFIGVLDREVGSVIGGLAAAGIGNERLILGEYSAVKLCFEACWPNSKYARFLDANITEDFQHSDLLADVASILIEQGASPVEYYNAAMRSVDARVKFYDRLANRILADQI